MSELSSGRREYLAAAHQLRLETARNAQGHRAGFVSRTIANLVDGIVVLAIEFSVYLLIAVIRFLFVRHFRLPTPGIVVSGLVFWGIAMLYLTTGWAATGKTTGKQIIGLRVVRQDGSRLTARRALARALLYAVILPGFALVLVSRKDLSLQDHLLETAVVYDWSYRALGA